MFRGRKADGTQLPQPAAPVPDADLVSAIRFHEAALNQFFAEAAERGLKIELEAQQNWFGFRAFGAEEWQERKMEPLRFTVIHRAL